MKVYRKKFFKAVFNISLAIFSLLFITNWIFKRDLISPINGSCTFERNETVYNDLIDGYVGPGYNLEEEYSINAINSRAIDNRDSCIY